MKKPIRNLLIASLLITIPIPSGSIEANSNHKIYGNLHQSELNHSDPATAMTIIAYAAKLSKFLSEKSMSRDIGSLKEQMLEALEHLRQIRIDIEIIKEQNQEILRKLDSLPAKVRSIVRDELKNNELDIRYAQLDNIVTNYAFSEEFRNSLKMDQLGYLLLVTIFLL